MGKTGGTTGTNQYQVRGSSRAAHLVPRADLLDQAQRPPQQVSQPAPQSTPTPEQFLQATIASYDPVNTGAQAWLVRLQSSDYWADAPAGAAKEVVQALSDASMGNPVRSALPRIVRLASTMSGKGQVESEYMDISKTIQAAASCPALSSTDLWELSQGCPRAANDIYLELGMRPDTPGDILAKVYKSTQVGEVRCAVLSNPNCPPKMLAKGVEYKSMAATAAICNPNIDPELLKPLYDRPADKMTRPAIMGLVCRPDTPGRTLVTAAGVVAKDFTWDGLHDLLLNHPNLDEAQRRRVAATLATNPKMRPVIADDQRFAHLVALAATAD